MKAPLLLLFTTGTLLACGSGYSNCYRVSFDHTKAGSSDTDNFPALISGTYSYFAASGNGGVVHNLTTQSGGAAIAVPADLIFATDATCSKPLSGWEFEAYASSTGAMTAWVNIGTLSSTADASIVACAGNASVTTWQGNVGSVWNAFNRVYHFGSSLSMADSAGNGDLSMYGLTATSGQIGGAVNDDGTLGNDLVITAASSFYALTSYSFSLWINMAGANRSGQNSTLLSTDSYQLYLDPAYRVSFGVSTTSSYRYTNSSAAVSTGSWHYLVVTYSVSDHQSHIYLDGVETSYAGRALGSGTDAVPSANVLLADYYNTYRDNYYGSLDELRVAAGALSADQILAEFNNQSSPSTFYTILPVTSGTSGSAAKRRLL